MKYRMEPREVAEKEVGCAVITSAPGDFMLQLCGVEINSERDLREAVRRLIEQDREHVRNTVPLGPQRI